MLANSYFVPDEDSIRLFSEAARRGVDVRILVPGKVNDVPATKAAGKSGFGELLRAGIRIYEYKPTMMHAKTMVVDGLFATVGSTNFDNRSFRLNEELDLTVYDEDFAKRMEKSFWQDMKRSRLYTLLDWSKRPNRERFLEWAIAPPSIATLGAPGRPRRIEAFRYRDGSDPDIPPKWRSVFCHLLTEHVIFLGAPAHNQLILKPLWK